jgi:lysophospholipase L1-like esterase
VSYTQIVALGSSFAAGPGIDPIVDRFAMRSGRNYAHLLAERLGAELTDLTVSGATTATILDHPQRSPLGKKFAPQIRGMPTHADLVTITAAGNDLHYAGSMLRAAFTGWIATLPLAKRLGAALAFGAIPDVGDTEIDAAASGLTRVVQAVRDRAPLARIVLVDYLTVMGDQTRTSPTVPIDQPTIDAFRTIGDQLAEAFAIAAHRSGADLVKASTASAEHALGSADPWVTGFSASLFAVTPFHPNAAGMRAVADEVQRRVTP